MDTLKYLSILVLVAVTYFASAKAESSINSIENTTQVTGRSGRKDYVVYSPPDNFASKKSGNTYPSEEPPKDVAKSFEPSIKPRFSKDEDEPQKNSPDYSPSSYEDYAPVGYYRPPSYARPARYYSSESNSPMYPSGTSVNWNVWKGDSSGTPPSPPPQGNKKGGGAPPTDYNEYYIPMDAWKGDPWMPDQNPMTMMMMMNQMHKPKMGGFLSKIFQDPLTLVIAALVPLSILLAAVLPTLMNMMMNGGLPTVTTTATGNTAAGRNLEGIEFLSPVFQTISTFGARSFENPDCMQRIFCQVTKGPAMNGTDSRSFQKALYSASKFIDSHWLETLGVKTLFDSMKDGDCTKIPCSAHSFSTRSAKQKSKAS